jgi:hypothetical protein
MRGMRGGRAAQFVLTQARVSEVTAAATSRRLAHMDGKHEAMDRGSMASCGLPTSASQNHVPPCNTSGLATAMAMWTGIGTGSRKHFGCTTSLRAEVNMRYTPEA